jgi:ABC-type multidrug transport system ATPase subunit
MQRLMFRIEKLHFSYNDNPVFENFSATSDAGIVILRGPSGCGKTTLLKLLSGHLEPDKVAYMPSPESSCLVIQEDGLFPWLSGNKNLLLGGNISHEEVSKHPLYFLIKDFADKRACNLSFGQRRKIELVRAFAHEFRLLCLDEPFNYIDPETKVILADYVSSDCMQNTLVVITTHYDADIRELDSDVFTMDGILPVGGHLEPLRWKATDRS